MSDGIVIIKKGREKPIVQQHPWIFSGAIHEVENDPKAGDIVTVISHQGIFLARGYWNRKSQIQVRILTWTDEEINQAWWKKMITRAIDTRKAHYDLENQSSALRIINAENDFIPGLIVDKYGEWLVLQALTFFIDNHKTMISELLAELMQVRGIYERSDVDVRHKEGLQQVTGMLWGEEAPEQIQIDEDVKIQIDVYDGHKTGFYLDQAQNRKLLTELITDGFSPDQPVSVLNLFSYTGGFGLHALKNESTSIVNVDTSFEALELAEQNVILNDFDVNRAEFIQADVFEYLRDMAEQGKEYDIVVLDPPKFAHNKQQISQAARGYKDINLNAFKVIKSGGYLLTFSCSGAIDADLFQKIVFGAMVDSGRQAQIIKRLSPGIDHPVALTFPEGAYLKGLLLKVY